MGSLSSRFITSFAVRWCGPVPAMNGANPQVSRFRGFAHLGENKKLPGKAFQTIENHQKGLAFCFCSQLGIFFRNILPIMACFNWGPRPWFTSGVNHPLLATFIMHLFFQCLGRAQCFSIWFHQRFQVPEMEESSPI